MPVNSPNKLSDDFSVNGHEHDVLCDQLMIAESALCGIACLARRCYPCGLAGTTKDAIAEIEQYAQFSERFDVCKECWEANPSIAYSAPIEQPEHVIMARQALAQIEQVKRA